jgi:hypothetical protein
MLKQIPLKDTVGKTVRSVTADTDSVGYFRIFIVFDDSFCYLPVIHNCTLRELMDAGILADSGVEEMLKEEEAKRIEALIIVRRT